MLFRSRESVAGLEVVVRLSAFDTIPYERGDGAGIPMAHEQLIPYLWGFGIDPQQPSLVDLAETIALLRSLKSLGVVAVNVSCGSPYYNPHLMRPAAFPPSDGYLPPEDPLVGVARQIAVARQCKQAVPDLVMVGSGYSYLQDYLPHVAQAIVREQAIDSVGLGRMVLSYPELPADTLLQIERVAGKFLRRFQRVIHIERSQHQRIGIAGHSVLNPGGSRSGNQAERKGCDNEAKRHRRQLYKCCEQRPPLKHAGSCDTIPEI